MIREIGIGIIMVIVLATIPIAIGLTVIGNTQWDNFLGYYPQCKDVAYSEKCACTIYCEEQGMEYKSYTGNTLAPISSELCTCYNPPTEYCTNKCEAQGKEYSRFDRIHGSCICEVK